MQMNDRSNICGWWYVHGAAKGNSGREYIRSARLTEVSRMRRAGQCILVLIHGQVLFSTHLNF